MSALAMERVTCKATARSGSRCKKSPEPGQDVCRMHGGSTPAARAAAAGRLLQARINGELRQRGWEPVTDPVAEYALIGGEVVAFKDLAREHMNALKDWALTIGGWDGDEGFQAQAEQARAVVQVYERALDRAERTMARMVGHGLDFTALAAALKLAQERPSREQAETLAAVIGRVLSDPRVSVEAGQANAVILDALRGLGE